MAKRSRHAGSSKARPEAMLIPPERGFAVRMYRQGLGDCFLVALSQGKAKRPFYVLFDCGIHSRQDDGPKRLLEVMEDLVEATGREIDVVVATHQHADHLSGFVQKDNPFVDGRIRVKTFWVAWTEKPGDVRAEELRKKHGAAREALNKAVEKLKRSLGTGLADRLDALRDFEKNEADPDPRAVNAAAKLKPARKPKATEEVGEDGEGTAAGSEKVSSTELAIQFLTSVAGEVHYCEPGESLALGNDTDARAYVLGPPRGVLLKRDLPTGGDESERRETYLAGGSSQQGFVLAPALGAAGSSYNAGTIPDDLCHPFDSSLRRSYLEPVKPADPVKWTDETIPRSTKEFYESHYFEDENDWRRVDGDWLGAAEELALNLDSDTNNTSLVLALEFGKPGEGKVAMFVGDAQVGNWLSWTDQKYKAGGQVSTIDDLFERTILYKVGHHGSHNATLKRDSRRPTANDKFGSPYGLELMKSALIAMIPVDRAAAEKKMPIAWHMPHPPLYESLLRKTAGRVLRADGLDPEPGVKGPRAVGPTDGENWDKVPGVPGAFWREALTSFSKGEKTRKCPLYYDVKFEL